MGKRGETGFPASGPNSKGGDQLLQRHQGEKHIVYTLYRGTTYQREAYRIHIADEGNPANPVYKLLCPSPKIHTSRVQAPTIQSHGIRIR